MLTTRGPMWGVLHYPHLQMRKRRLREGEGLVYGHMAGRGQVTRQAGSRTCTLKHRAPPPLLTPRHLGQGPHCPFPHHSTGRNCIFGGILGFCPCLCPRNPTGTLRGGCQDRTLGLLAWTQVLFRLTSRRPPSGIFPLCLCFLICKVG